MAHKKQHGGPIPPGNLPQGGPGGEIDRGQSDKPSTRNKDTFQEQDPKRRLGDYDGAGEHAFQQPGGKNDANH